MTVAYDLGTPPAAEDRAGDCHAWDLDQAPIHPDHPGRLIVGPHRFVATTHCRIDNGLLSLTVNAAGAAPSLTVEAFTGYRSIEDFYFDVYDDSYPGSYSPPEWTPMGTLTIDSTLLTALLTGVQLVRITPERLTIRLVSPVMADAYVTLRRGEPMVRIQHGSTRAPLVSTNRRIAWADTGLTGSSGTGRVTETAPLTDNFARFVGAGDTASSNAGAFSVTATGVTSARFVAGVGTPDYGTTVADLHGQLADSSRGGIFIGEDD